MITFLRDKYYEMRLWWLEHGNIIKYTFLNLLDEPPKRKRKENTEQYLNRIEAKYALRIARYYYKDFLFLMGRLKFLEQSVKNESKKEQELWQFHHDMIKDQWVQWDYYLTLAEKRKFEEKYLAD